MTGIDLMVSMMLLTCVPHEPLLLPPNDRGRQATVQLYLCPLMGDDAEFLVWRRVCPIDEDRPAFALANRVTKQGFLLNLFTGIDPAFVNIDAMPAVLPSCQG